MDHKVTDRAGKRSPGPVIGTVKSYEISFWREIHFHSNILDLFSSQRIFIWIRDIRFISFEEDVYKNSAFI